MSRPPTTLKKGNTRHEPYVKFTDRIILLSRRGRGFSSRSFGVCIADVDVDGLGLWCEIVRSERSVALSEVGEGRAFSCSECRSGLDGVGAGVGISVSVFPRSVEVSRLPG